MFLYLNPKKKTPFPFGFPLSCEKDSYSKLNVLKNQKNKKINKKFREIKEV